jgi:TolB-like protein/Tfp pilus assembly protein PilF/predicted Ser/Thr protein kinase
MQIGQTISHYRILKRLGEGGMGVVYEAADTRLERTVALKFLHQQAMESKEARLRLINEAKAAAALQHANICTVHEIGEAEGQIFIAMAYLQGQSLSEKISTGPLLPAEAVELAIQIGQGLQAAHVQGIVHRDLKPANIMVTDQGQAVVMDFGLAQKADVTRLTRTGTTVGTAAYMSPEQVRGEAVDQKADIWALGAVLYEALTGRQPFEGDNVPALMYSVLNTEPALPSTGRTDVPKGLDAIVAKTLAKAADQRYQQMADLIEDLQALRDDPAAFPAGKRPRRRLTRGQRLTRYGALAAVLLLVCGLGWHFWPGRGPHGPLIASLAVLPLTNLSGGEEHDDYADGLTMELTSVLGRIADLRVVSRRSAMRYKGSDKSVADIAQDLHVDALVEGSIQLAANRLYITAQLIDAAKDKILWSDSFDGDLRDVMNLQREMARQIARNLMVQLTPSEEALLAERRRVDPEVYALYLKGKLYVAKFVGESLYTGIDDLKQAIAKDPGYAPAYATLALAYTNAAFGGHIQESEAYPLAKEAANHAIGLDETLSEAHAALGASLSYHDQDWVSRADQHFRRALELDPGCLECMQAYTFFLNRNARFAEAIAISKRHLELDPISAPQSKNLFYVYFYARQYDLARAQAEKTFELLQLYPDAGTEFLVRRMLPQIEILAGNYGEAQRQIDELMHMANYPEEYAEDYIGHAQYAQVLLDAKTGKPESARAWLEGDHYPWSKAIVAAALGDKDLAFENLEILYEHDESVIEFVKMSPDLDSLHGDPRFDDLLRRLGFSEET